MSNEPTMSAKIAALQIASGGRIEEADIRQLIADRKIRSFKRLDEVAAELKADYEAALAKENEEAAKAKLDGEVEAAPKYVPGLIRGYSFGKVWLNHVQQVADGSKYALRPTKYGKLVATAKHVGVDVDPTVLTQKELAMMISDKLRGIALPA